MLEHPSYLCLDWNFVSVAGCLGYDVLGSGMFSTGKAFGDYGNNFPHSVIIDHWTGVLARLNKKDKENENN